MNLPNKLTTLRVIMIPFFVFFPFFVGEGNKKNARAHNFCSKMCSLARSYYRGNRTQKSTAITAKLFVFLIDIFSKIHKSPSFSV